MISLTKERKVVAKNQGVSSENQVAGPALDPAHADPALVPDHAEIGDDPGPDLGPVRDPDPADTPVAPDLDPALGLDPALDLGHVKDRGEVVELGLAHAEGLPPQNAKNPAHQNGRTHERTDRKNGQRIRTEAGNPPARFPSQFLHRRIPSE